MYFINKAGIVLGLLNCLSLTLYNTLSFRIFLINCIQILVVLKVRALYFGINKNIDMKH